MSVERRKFELHFPKVTLGVDYSAAKVPEEWRVVFDAFAAQAHRVDQMQLIVQTLEPGATPTTADVDIDLQYNVGEADDDVVVGQWASLLNIADIATAGLAKTAVYTAPIPRRLRMLLNATAVAWNGGLTIEAWVIFNIRAEK